jgi:RNA polymerase sigma-B factor
MSTNVHALDVGPRAQGLTKDQRATWTTELFARVAATTDDAEKRQLRSQIVELNVEIARSIALRYRGRGEQLEDLEQVACLGLVQAVSRYDPSFGKHFLTFAVPTITGEVKKHFRDRAWTVRPPRRIQDLQSRISATLPELQQQLHRSPTPAQVAEALDEPIEDVIEALAADGCFLPSSLDRPVVNEQGAAALGDLLGAADPDLDRTEAHLTLIPAVQSLTEEDRKIIELRFFHDLSQIQIAEALGTNQMRVSRALTRILSTMRNQIAS